MRQWSGKFQKLWNFRLKHRCYRFEQVHNFIVRGGNLTLKSRSWVSKQPILEGGHYEYCFSILLRLPKQMQANLNSILTVWYTLKCYKCKSHSVMEWLFALTLMNLICNYLFYWLSYSNLFSRVQFSSVQPLSNSSIIRVSFILPQGDSFFCSSDRIERVSLNNVLAFTICQPCPKTFSVL
jgi:hypothetical protein